MGEQSRDAEDTASGVGGGATHENTHTVWRGGYIHDDVSCRTKLT